MKNRILRILCVGLLLCALTANSVTAFADVNNQIIGGGSSTYGYSSGPSVADIQITGEQSKIVLPANSEYLRDYQLMYIYAPKGNYVYVRRAPDSTSTERADLMPNGYDGTEAIVLATNRTCDTSCILYLSSDNRVHAGWIANEYLSSIYMRQIYTCGQFASQYATEFLGWVSADWSAFNFVGTSTRFTETDQPIYNVLSLTIDYQIYSRNGVDHAYGGRDVYVNDGSGWFQAGSFEVNKNFDSVHYVINFNFPVTIQAVACIPQDLSTQGFLFNQFIVDVITAA